MTGKIHHGELKKEKAKTPKEKAKIKARARHNLQTDLTPANDKKVNWQQDSGEREGADQPKVLRNC